MDNYTHSLAGWALGQTGLKRKSRKGLASLILGANMPDIDVFFGWVDWVPLATHRGFTHGLIGGVVLMPPLLAGLLWLLDRWQLVRGAHFRSGLAMHFGWLLALCYLGALTHPLLDLQTTYSVQLLSPFDTRWFHAEALFIIDVWIWSGLSFAIWLSRRRERRRRHWRTPAILGLVGLLAYIGINGAISLRARDALRVTVQQPAPEVIFAGEEPVLFWKRSMVWRAQGGIGRASYDPFDDLYRVSKVTPLVADNMSDPLVRRAMGATEQVRQFMRWSILPMARIERTRCTVTVLFSDARFGEPRAGDRFLRKVAMPTGAAGCAAGADMP